MSGGSDLERAQPSTGCVDGGDQKPNCPRYSVRSALRRLVVVDEQHPRRGASSSPHDQTPEGPARASARRAGKAPKPSPVATLTPKLDASADAGSARSPIEDERDAERAAIRRARARSPNHPEREQRPPEGTGTRMSRGVAPTAIRRPISLVRSRTESNMSAMIAVPATPQRHGGEARSVRLQRRQVILRCMAE